MSTSTHPQTFPIGASVLVSFQDAHEFLATVKGYRTDTDGTPLYTVVDQDDEGFDAEASELRLYDSAEDTP